MHKAVSEKNTVIMKNKVLRIHPKDNVLVALQDLEKDDAIHFEGNAIRLLLEDIPAKHKFYLKEMEPGDEVFHVRRTGWKDPDTCMAGNAHEHRQ
jgi:hypothetical protein